MFVKFMSVGFLLPIEMSLDLQEPALISFRKKNQNERDCVQWHLFFLYFASP